MTDSKLGKKKKIYKCSKEINENKRKSTTKLLRSEITLSSIAGNVSCLITRVEKKDDDE